MTNKLIKFWTWFDNLSLVKRLGLIFISLLGAFIIGKLSKIAGIILTLFFLLVLLAMIIYDLRDKENDETIN